TLVKGHDLLVDLPCHPLATPARLRIENPLKTLVESQRSRVPYPHRHENLNLRRENPHLRKPLGDPLLYASDEDFHRTIEIRFSKAQKIRPRILFDALAPDHMMRVANDRAALRLAVNVLEPTKNHPLGF